MRSRLGFVWTGILSLVSVAAPSPGRGDQFTAPGAVVANLDGSFSFDARFLKEGAPDLLGGYGWFGMTNVTGGYSGDCFCESFCTMQPGATITIHVDGQLTDPTQQGTANSWVSFCTPGNNYGAVTTVYPYGTTGVGEPAIAEAARFWNAPNPVRPHTTFHWNLSQAGAVSLRIYDLAGRRLVTLVDEMQAAGEHRAELDVGGPLWLARPNGVYYAQLSVLGQSKRLALIVIH